VDWGGGLKKIQESKGKIAKNLKKHNKTSKTRSKKGAGEVKRKRGEFFKRDWTIGEEGPERRFKGKSKADYSAKTKPIKKPKTLKEERKKNKSGDGKFGIHQNIRIIQDGPLLSAPKEGGEKIACAPKKKKDAVKSTRGKSGGEKKKRVTDKEK